MFLRVLFHTHIFFPLFHVYHKADLLASISSEEDIPLQYSPNIHHSIRLGILMYVPPPPLSLKRWEALGMITVSHLGCTDVLRSLFVWCLCLCLMERGVPVHWYMELGMRLLVHSWSLTAAAMSPCFDSLSEENLLRNLPSAARRTIERPWDNPTFNVLISIGW